MKLPTCIPVTWKHQGVYHLAYHHGFTDPRLYSICRLPGTTATQTMEELPDLLATVDDFGNLVPIAEQSRWAFFPKALIPVWIQRGDVELH